MPPLPLRFTAPTGHALIGDTAPELAQSLVVPGVPRRRMLPSTASHGVGAASAIWAATTADPHASAPATAAVRHLPFLSGRVKVGVSLDGRTGICSRRRLGRPVTCGFAAIPHEC